VTAVTPSLGTPRPRGVVLAAIACSGTLAMHMFVPALPIVVRELDTTPAAAQLTLTVYLIGIAAGQLLYGPLSDRFGRRPVLIASLALFLMASLVAALAPDIQWLIAARVVQALGACGGLGPGRAMARDGATPEQAARQLALLVMVMTASPAIAPLLGSIVATVVGWRGIFGLLGAVAAGLLLLAVASLPETSRQRTPRPGARALLAVYGQLLRRSEFRAYAIGDASERLCHGARCAASFGLRDRAGVGLGRPYAGAIPGRVYARYRRLPVGIQHRNVAAAHRIEGDLADAEQHCVARARPFGAW
jgi:DHA1 family bicyclomycin/chloramphenicol resistance-like MFS transporter